MSSYAADGEPVGKKTKTSGGGVLDPALFGDARCAALRRTYEAATPFPHVVVENLGLEAPMERARLEAIGELKADYKETDLFKVYQVPQDLGTIERTAPELAAKAPALLRLRDALYSAETKRLVERVTGCGPIGDAVDCSANVYARGGHLLCHDDVIGDRLVSYVLYLTEPEGWSADDGGSFEFYAFGADGEPEAAPCARVAPAWNSLMLFRVEPSASFHSVQEVYGDKPRLTISGWYHARDGRDGAASRASLAELTRPRARTIARFAGDDDGDDDALSDADLDALRAWVSPVYLDPATWPKLKDHFAESSAAHPTTPRASAALRAAAQAAPLELAGAGADSSPAALLARVRADASGAPFRRLVRELVGVRPVGQGVARRFRPGCDYTVAHGATGCDEPRLDLTFCFLSHADPAAFDADVWACGDYGGFETYVEADGGGDRADVYEGDAGEGRDDGGDLLSVEAAHNTLSVVLRDPGTLRFVKYVSVEAPGSLWDLEMVCELHPDDHPDPDAGDDESEDE
ncbi:hypothetical protein JL721_421 [Aureococcus anophagefferens]|nr:hypothetical protein JL721_421 [Aureococcus anophagefferens]